MPDPESVWEMEYFDKLPPQLKDYIHNAAGHLAAGNVYALWIQYGIDKTIETLDSSVRAQLAEEKAEIEAWARRQSVAARRQPGLRKWGIPRAV